MNQNVDGRTRNIEAYESAKPEMERHRGQFVTVRGGRIVAYSSTLDEAFRIAEGDPDALVLEAGAPPVREPARLGSHTWRGV